MGAAASTVGSTATCFEGLRRAERFLGDVRAGRAEPEQALAACSPRPWPRRPRRAVLLAARRRRVFADAGGTEHQELYTDGRERTPLCTAVRSSWAWRCHRALGSARVSPRAVLEMSSGLGIEIARLRVEQRRQIEEVEASRARIVSAGNEERRRIERNLHDGAQQRLVSIGLALRHAQHELGPGLEGPRSAIDGAVEEITLAIEELRELARGVRPAQLDDGLGAALRDLAQRAPLPVNVTATSERVDGDLEAAAYFIACEGLTNAVKHARATRVSLSAERSHGQLIVAVTDDDVGGAVADAGSGLRGLSDRVGAHNGVLRIESVPGAGTRLVAELPCGS